MVTGFFSVNLILSSSGLACISILIELENFCVD